MAKTKGSPLVPLPQSGNTTFPQAVSNLAPQRVASTTAGPLKVAPGFYDFYKDSSGAPTVSTTRDPTAGARVSGMTNQPMPPGYVGTSAGGGFMPSGPLATSKVGQTTFGQHGGEFFDPTNLDAFLKQYGPEFGKPGATETMFGNLGDTFGTAGPLESFWSSIAGKFNNAPTTSNNAQGAYETYMRDRPTLPEDAGVGKFYENAETRATDRLNQQFAARGAYGSSVSQGQIGQTVGDLEASRAEDEAKYRLARGALEQQWAGGLAPAARSADLSSLAASQNELDWLKGGGILANLAQASGMDRARLGLEAAGAADRSRLARLGLGADVAGATDTGDLNSLIAGMNAAFGAEGLSRGESSDAFTQMFAPLALLTSLSSGAYSGLIGGDSQNLSTLIQLLLGKGSEGVTAENNTQQGGTADLAAVIKALTGAKEAKLF